MTHASTPRDTAIGSRPEGEVSATALGNARVTVGVPVIRPVRPHGDPSTAIRQSVALATTRPTTCTHAGMRASDPSNVGRLDAQRARVLPACSLEVAGSELTIRVRTRTRHRGHDDQSPCRHANHAADFTRERRAHPDAGSRARGRTRPAARPRGVGSGYRVRPPCRRTPRSSAQTGRPRRSPRH